MFLGGFGAENVDKTADIEESTCSKTKKWLHFWKRISMTYFWCRGQIFGGILTLPSSSSASSSTSKSTSSTCRPSLPGTVATPSSGTTLWPQQKYEIFSLIIIIIGVLRNLGTSCPRNFCWKGLNYAMFFGTPCNSVVPKRTWDSNAMLVLIVGILA